jgi:hypothetical protein
LVFFVGWVAAHLIVVAIVVATFAVESNAAHPESRAAQQYIAAVRNDGELVYVVLYILDIVALQLLVSAPRKSPRFLASAVAATFLPILSAASAFIGSSASDSYYRVEYAQYLIALLTLALVMIASIGLVWIGSVIADDAASLYILIASPPLPPAADAPARRKSFRCTAPDVGAVTARACVATERACTVC